MDNVLFISETFLKDNTLLHENIDFKYLRPVVLMCQDIHIQHKIGTTLYDELKAQITASSLTTANETLLEDYIQPALVEWVTYSSILYFNYKITNKAVVKKSSDNSEASSLNEVNFLRQSIRDDAEYYTDRLAKYLCANEVLFPEYIEGNINDDDIVPSKKSFFGGIYLN